MASFSTKRLIYFDGDFLLGRSLPTTIMQVRRRLKESSFNPLGFKEKLMWFVPLLPMVCILLFILGALYVVISLLIRHGY